MLAALGSVLLLSVTSHITQNVASIPFLWVLPLSIYLLTFILCFDGTGWYRRPVYGALAALLAVAMLAGLSFRLDGWRVERLIMDIAIAIPIYVFGLFALCMFLHGEMAARKPLLGPADPLLPDALARRRDRRRERRARRAACPAGLL